MARIRSIHPGVWTDEDFFELSFEARLAVIELWSRAEGPSGVVHKRHALKFGASMPGQVWVREAFDDFLRVRRLDQAPTRFAEVDRCRADVAKSQRRWLVHRKTLEVLGISYSAWRALRLAVFQRDAWKCRYCGASSPFLECDHAHPLSRGGATDLNNLVTACRTCNRQKGARLISEWRS